MQQTLPIRRTDEDRLPPVDVVRMVRRCRTKRITGEDKLAYQFLYGETQGGRRAILTTPSDIADDQGTSSDTGRTRLKNLKSVGLIDYKPAQKRGSYEVWLLEPFTALRALGTQDPQLDLPFENTAGEPPSKAQHGHAGDVPCSPAEITVSPGRPPPPPWARPWEEEPRQLAEDPPEEPRQLAEDPRFAPPSRKPSEPSISLSESRPLTIHERSTHSGNGSQPLASQDASGRGSSGGSSAELDLVAEVARRQQQLGIPKQVDTVDVTRVASIAASMARIPSPRELQAKRDNWKHVIQTRVRDANLQDCVIDKVTCAVVAGELEESELLTILSNIDKHRREGTLRGPPGKYFFFSVRACFQRRGLTWVGYQKPKPR